MEVTLPERTEASKNAKGQLNGVMGQLNGVISSLLTKSGFVSLAIDRSVPWRRDDRNGLKVSVCHRRNYTLSYAHMKNTGVWITAFSKNTLLRMLFLASEFRR